MRAQLSGPRVGSLAGLGVARMCAVPGCRRVAIGFEMCDDCRAMDLDIERHWREKQLAKVQSRAARRLRTFALVSAFVVLMNWLAIEVWPRLWLAFKVWKLGSN
jgi:hypothetical protein